MLAPLDREVGLEVEWRRIDWLSASLRLITATSKGRIKAPEAQLPTGTDNGDRCPLQGPRGAQVPKVSRVS
jgi:hypothetical protein